MNILDNEWVRKYFGCHHMIGVGNDCGGDCIQQEAYNILRSMQEPIKNGERVLYIDGNFAIGELQRGCDLPGFHPWALRLPDRFQKRDVVEENIQALKDEWADEIGMDSRLDSQLRDLVRLARKA